MKLITTLIGHLIAIVIMAFTSQIRLTNNSPFIEGINLMIALSPLIIWSLIGIIIDYIQNKEVK